MSNWRHALAAVAFAICAVELCYLLFVYEGSATALLSSRLSELSTENDFLKCDANVTILGTFALTADMPCTALFELTLGSLLTYLPELRLCPKILVFEGTQERGREQHEQQRYDDFFQNVQRLGIPNLKLLQLANHTELIGSVRYGLSHVTTSLIFLWQPDLMLRRRPKDWPQILQKLQEDDAPSASAADRIRDVHFGYHHDWDVFQHGPRKRFNSSAFVEDVYIIQYCDQIQVATVSFFREIFPLIDLKLQKMAPEDWGRSGSYMEDNQDVINANHSSVRYGSCYKAHCDKDKRRQADGYWDHWFYIHPSNLLSDIFHFYEKTRPCRQWNMQLCLPWAPDWFQPKALGCNYADQVALYGRLSVMLWLLLYGGLGGLLAWALRQCLLKGRKGRPGRLCAPVQALLLCAVCCLPWALVAFSWELAHDHICWNPPRICGKGKNR